jgi:hypothetical protein
MEFDRARAICHKNIAIRLRESESPMVVDGGNNTRAAYWLQTEDSQTKPCRRISPLEAWVYDDWEPLNADAVSIVATAADNPPAEVPPLTKTARTILSYVIRRRLEREQQ